jgi:hypothetical protein
MHSCAFKALSLLYYITNWKCFHLQWSSGTIMHMIELHTVAEFGLTRRGHTNRISCQ